MIIGHYMRDIWAQGGIASYIRRISAKQAELGHQVYFFDNIAYAHPEEELEKPVTYVADDDELFRLAKEFKIEALHTHLSISGNVKKTVPVLRTLHGHQPYCPSGGRFLKREGVPCNRNFSVLGCLAGHVLSRCGSIRPATMRAAFATTRDEMSSLQGVTIVTVSHFMRNQLIRAGYDGDKVHVLYLPVPGVRDYVPPPADDVPHFLYLGRLSPQKGVDWLLRAMKDLDCPAHLDIAGEGYYQPNLKELADKLNINDRVTFHGWVQPDQAKTLLQNARALVFPSLWHEPGGTVAMEAMVNGRAVIMSKVGGMPEVVIEGENGLIVEPNDTKGLTGAIKRLAQDVDLARQLGERGYQSVPKRFAMDDHIDRLMEIYDSVVAEANDTAGTASASRIPVQL